MPLISWENLDGTIYGTLGHRTDQARLTFRIDFEDGWVRDCSVFDNQQPTNGWKRLVGVQHYKKDEPNYFPPRKKNDTLNNEAGVELLKRHVEFLFDRRYW